jgi:hypothetical protein
VWINSDVDDAAPLGELFQDVLGRAREHVRVQREALAQTDLNRLDPTG